MIPLLALPFPVIDPVLIEIGPFAIRWYALAYIAGLLIGWRVAIALARRRDTEVEPIHADDFLMWATLGVVLGGRLGYVLFYRPEYYFSNPLEIFVVWQGGMSFHGGLLGVCAALVLFAWRRKVPLLGLSDVIAVVAPIGLFFGRLANFINAELFGRVSDVPWAMVFPNGGPLPRHPSQLYEAGLEGLLSFAVLLAVVRWTPGFGRRGLVTGSFLIAYSLSRNFAELFRQPDLHIGFLLGGTTMGQWLSWPMVAVGVGLVGFALYRRPTAGKA